MTMLTPFVYTIIIFIAFCTPSGSQDRVRDCFDDMTGKGVRTWIYDGAERRSNKPRPQCGTWTFGTNMRVTIKPCRDEARSSDWRIFEEDGYVKVLVEDVKYIVTTDKDPTSQTWYMELENRGQSQGTPSEHKSFHWSSGKPR
jgi:hypothetical protein